MSTNDKQAAPIIIQEESDEDWGSSSSDEEEKKPEIPPPSQKSNGWPKVQLNLQKKTTGWPSFRPKFGSVVSQPAIRQPYVFPFDKEPIDELTKEDLFDMLEDTVNWFRSFNAPLRKKSDRMTPYKLFCIKNKKNAKGDTEKEKEKWFAKEWRALNSSEKAIYQKKADACNRIKSNE